MTLSMTGFGRGVSESSGNRFIVEAKAVNSRYCEVRVSAPREFLSLEHKLSQRVKERFSRGKFDLILRLESGEKPSSTLNEKEVIRKWKILDGIRRKLKIHDPFPLDRVIQWSSDRNHEWPKDAPKEFEKAAEEAFEKLERFRSKEGKSLAKDIRDRAKFLSRCVRDIGKAADGGRKKRFSKMKARLKEILDEQSLDERRIAVEIALLVERADVTEEIVRLKNHIVQIVETLRQKGSVGRKLDFLLQEANREINTIGSKSADLSLTDLVVQVKAELEKIREQAQNIE